MKKRLSFLLALALVFSLASVTAIPAGAVQTFDVWVAGVQVTVLNRDDVLGDGTVSYDAGARALTLKDAKIENLDEDVEEGDAIVARQELTITGTGSISALKNGITAYAPLTIQGAKLTIQSKESNSINVGYDLTIRNSDLTVLTSQGVSCIDVYTAEEGESYSATLIEDSKIIAKSDEELSVAIETDDLTIRNSEITAEGGQTGIYAHGSSFLIEDSKVIAQSGYGGITAFRPDFTIRNSEVTARGGKTKGIRVTDTALLIQGERTVVTADSEEDYAIYAKKGIEIDDALAIREPEGGKLDAEKQTVMEDNDVVKAMHVVIGAKDKTAENPFTDVKESDYFYDAVLWAYYAEPQVTNGIGGGLFGPDNTVKRGEAVTFLWRSVGCPEPTSTKNPFEDVKESDYFYKPVLWAVEKGITVGTDATHFTPEQTCSTAHIITFLYRTLNPGQDGWYAMAEGYAQGAGLMDGHAVTVSPDVDCPRADVVFFLHRALAK